MKIKINEFKYSKIMKLIILKQIQINSKNDIIFPNSNSSFARIYYVHVTLE